MNGDLGARLDEVVRMPIPERAAPLIELARAALESGTGGQAVPLIHPMLALIEEGAGTPRERLELGEVLGLLGDPRLRRPVDPDYWVTVPGEDGSVIVGRYPVTTSEFRTWVDEGGYERTDAWSPEGREWLASCDDPWRVVASGADSLPFVVPNQPVVGITFFEAEAYASSFGARLLLADERVWVIRGGKRRPYPWGEPFGEGNANTREEVLGRPCAVGLYMRDRTPEGVCDLAGNVAEWLGDGLGGSRLIHPGAWDQPSMAAWAKAKDLRPPTFRAAGLGFRIARDLSIASGSSRPG